MIQRDDILSMEYLKKTEFTGCFDAFYKFHHIYFSFPTVYFESTSYGSGDFCIKKRPGTHLLYSGTGSSFPAVPPALRNLQDALKTSPLFRM